MLCRNIFAILYGAENERQNKPRKKNPSTFVRTRAFDAWGTYYRVGRVQETCGARAHPGDDDGCGAID